MKIAIVDDQQEFLDIIKRKIQSMKHDIYTFISVYDMEKEEITFDLLLLDIEMPDCDGVSYSKAHKEKNIIFITSKEERMKEAFGSNVYGFIEKSDNDQRYIEVIDNAIKEILNEKYICFNINQRYYDFLLKDIVYFQYYPYKKIGFLYRGNQYNISGITLKILEPQLKGQFIFIDRGIMVNKEKIIDMIDSEIFVDGIAKPFKVSRGKEKEIKNLVKWKI